MVNGSAHRINKLLFGIGIVLIVVGLLIQQVPGPWGVGPWGNIINGCFNTIGLMISFAQIFVPFPLLPISRSVPLPVPPPYSNSYPYSMPQPNIYNPYSMPQPNIYKGYPISGLVLWAGALCLIGATISLVILYSLISINPNAIPIGYRDEIISRVLTSLQGAIVFHLFADICILCGLRGLQKRLLQCTSALGRVLGSAAILFFTTALLLDILIYIIGLFVTPSSTATTGLEVFIAVTAPSSGLMSTLDTLVITVNCLTIISEVLLGSSFILGKVHPVWVGVLAILLGIATIPSAFSPESTPSILVVILFGLAYITQYAVFGWILIRGTQSGQGQVYP